MTLLETLVLTIGTSIAKSLLKVWLKEHPVAAAVTTSAVDLIKSKSGNIVAARKAEREFAALGDRIASSLEPVFRSYEFDGDSRDASYEAVANELDAAIAEARISAKLLASLSYDPAKLSAHIKEKHPQGEKLFSEVESALYNRVIDLAAQYIIDLASNLPDYTASNFTEILLRLDIYMSKLNKILEDLENLRATSEMHNRQRLYADFETDYRATMARKLNRVNLFGAGISRALKRYQLTVAYISLGVHRSGLNAEGSEDRISVETALAQTEKKRSAIIGEAGSGKTTLLHWLAVNSAASSFDKEMATWGHYVPFLIELRRYVDGPPPPEKFVSQVVPEIAERMPDMWVHDTLKSGRALLLVDGLDEVAPNKREAVLDWLESMIFSYPDVRMVFTSRPAAYEKGWLKPLEFEEFTLEPMQYSDIEMFLEYWHKAVLVDQDIETDEQAKVISIKLLDKLRNSLPLMRLSTNPLLCAMLCALHYELQMQLPADRNALYEACISMLLERRDIEREIQLQHYPELTYKQKRVLLDDLAYWMMKNGYSSVQTREAIARIASRLQNMQTALTSEADRVLSMLIERSGIIREPSLGTLDWVHRTFQEYMAASAASSEGDWGLLVKNATDDQWQETIILAAGFANKSQASALIGNLLDLAQQSAGQRAYLNLLAISCLETAVEISPGIRERLERLLATLIPPKDRDQTKHLAAAGNLAVQYLARRDTYSEVEAAACIRILGMIGTRPALAKMGTYVHDKRKAVREAIRSALKHSTPQEVFASGLAEELKPTLEDYIDGNRMRLDGTLLYALSCVPMSELRIHFPPEISSLELADFRPSNIFVINMLPNLRSLMLSGNLDIDIGLLLGLELTTLDLRNEGSYWPSFRNCSSFGSLQSLRLMSISEVVTGSPWPDLFALSELPNLTHLSIFVECSTDFPDFEVLSRFRRLEYLHISNLLWGWPDFEPLSRLPNLKEIELSMTPDSVPETLLGIEALTNLRRVVLNVDKVSSEVSDLAVGLEIFVPNCEIEIREGWSASKW